MMSVAHVDDQALFRAGIRMLVAPQPDLEVVGEAGNGQEAFVAAIGPVEWLRMDAGDYATGEGVDGENTAADSADVGPDTAA